jgi:tetratricopeptide (TPR) repeat protein
MASPTATTDYDEAILWRPDYVKAYNYRGAAYADLGQYTEAISDYDEAIRLRPDLPEAYSIRGLSYTQLGRYAEAIADLETALKLAQAAGNDDLAASIEEALKVVRNP